MAATEAPQVGHAVGYMGLGNAGFSTASTLAKDGFDVIGSMLARVQLGGGEAAERVSGGCAGRGGPGGVRRGRVEVERVEEVERMEKDFKHQVEGVNGVL
ncbi:hypothetical protein SVAN01_04135 [Stagonosporopsis vannaccii]|nr:hypothetical protein SVAN01_04135 [Stagonosporopsis vannaccii]